MNYAKFYLTKTGILTVREDNAFFTDNIGNFRRLASPDEVEYLTGHTADSDPILPKFNFNPTVEEALDELLRNYQVPLWRHLWTVNHDDYSSYRAGTSNNGGDYSFHTYTHYFARKNGGKWEYYELETHGTSAEFEYDQMEGGFQQRLDCVEIIGIANADPVEWTFSTQNGGEDGQLVLDQIGTPCSLEEALSATDYLIPEKDSEEEEGKVPLTDEQRASRMNVLSKLGVQVYA